ncbi:MAG: hypothetical protein IPK44_24845, partial [Candidatus Accumulibacter sp.]|nr:hypothetical protein [Accumulibacter sp.]
MLGAGAVGAIEGAYGPQAWALAAAKKGGIEALVKQFADAKSIPAAIGKGIMRGGAIEGAEELVQNPIEQVASYQDPTTRQAIGETLFGGAMGAIGGGVLGGGMGGFAKAMEPAQSPAAGATGSGGASVPVTPGSPSSTAPAIDPVADPLGTLTNPAAGIMSRTAATGEITGANEQKRQEQAIASAAAPITGTKNEGTQAGAQDSQGKTGEPGPATVAAGAVAPTGLAGVATGAPAGAAGNLPAQPSDVAPEQQTTSLPFQEVTANQSSLAENPVTAEPAGAPITPQGQQDGNQAQIPEPAAAGQSTQPASAADAAAAEREWQDFVANEGRDLGARRLAVLREQFMERRRMDAGIESATGRIEAGRRRQAAANRMAILDAIPLTTAGNSIRRFALALQRAGIADARVSQAERQLIARRIAARDTLQPLEQVPQNELTLPEKQSRLAVAPTLPRMDALRRKLAMPGVRASGNRLLDRNGKRLDTLSDSEAAELSPKHRPATDEELAAFIKDETADLAKRRNMVLGLQAIRKQKQVEDADKADLDALIESERADLRERMIHLRQAQAAAREKKPFVIPALTTPAQPTSIAGPLEQTAAPMSL